MKKCEKPVQSSSQFYIETSLYQAHTYSTTEKMEHRRMDFFMQKKMNIEIYIKTPKGEHYTKRFHLYNKESSKKSFSRNKKVTFILFI
jgi:uncharacterized lipoprotein YajG